MKFAIETYEKVRRLKVVEINKEFYDLLKERLSIKIFHNQMNYGISFDGINDKKIKEVLKHFNHISKYDINGSLIHEAVEEIIQQLCEEKNTALVTDKGIEELPEEDYDFMEIYEYTE